jgi:phospholipid/cholesterol/gamma-HCH transport system substrate-binding protein
MSASPSRSIAAPLAKLLVFAVVTLVATAALAQTLGSLWSSGGTSYRAEFTDVTGVLPGDDVRIAGVKVGRVQSVRLVRHTVAQLSFTVDEHVALSTDVHATVRYRNLIGQRYLALTEAPDGAGRLPAHGLIPISQTTPALDLTALFNGFRPLFTALTPGDVNSLAYEIIQVLQGDGGTVSDLLSHTASLTTALADRDQVISQVITNLDAVLSTLDAHRDELSQTIAALQQFVSGLAADRDAIGTAIDNIGGLTQATASLLGLVRPDLAHDITGLGSLADLLAANSAVIDTTLAKLPQQYQALTGTASDGSWFNFFMCSFDGNITVPKAGGVNPATFSAASARCGGGH